MTRRRLLCTQCLRTMQAVTYNVPKYDEAFEDGPAEGTGALSEDEAAADGDYNNPKGESEESEADNDGEPEQASNPRRGHGKKSQGTTPKKVPATPRGATPRRVAATPKAAKSAAKRTPRSNRSRKHLAADQADMTKSQKAPAPNTPIPQTTPSSSPQPPLPQPDGSSPIQPCSLSSAAGDTGHPALPALTAGNCPASPEAESSPADLSQQ